jgi:uncharacterized GH25 family protein
MKRSLPGGMLAAGLVVLLAAFWLLRERDAPGTDGGAGAAPLTASRTAQAPSRFEDAAEPATPTDAAGALPPAALDDAATSGATAPSGAPAVLTGRITHALDGTPAADVRLLAVVSVDGVRSKPPLDEAASQLRTDAEGRYRLVYTRACAVTQLRALPGPRSVRTVHDVQLPLQPGTETVRDLTVGSGSALAGRVVDTEGRPIPDAQVGSRPDASISNFENEYEPDRVTVADGAGEFVLEAIGSPFTIWASAPGYALREMLVGELAEGARLGLGAGGRPIEPPLTLVLSPARRIAGIVLGPDGAPAPRAYVTLGPVIDDVQKVTAAPGIYRKLAVPESAVRTGEDGRFARDGLCSVPYAVTAYTPDTAAWRGTHAPGDPDLVIRLGAGLSLSGTVTAARDGGPIAGARVTIHMSTDGATAFTDEHGAFTLAGLEPDEDAEVDVTADGYAVLVRKPVVVSESGNAPLRLALDPEHRLAVRVMDVAGAPVPEAWVSIEGDRIVDFGGMIVAPVPTWESRVGLERGLTDAEGRFRFDQLYAGSFQITAEHPQDETLTATLTAPSVAGDAGSEELLLVLDPHATSGVALHGVATDALTGRPVTDFDVTPMIPQGHGAYGDGHHFTSEDGAWRITGLDPGRLQLTAQAQGCAPWSAPMQDYEAGVHRIDIAFVASRQVRLRVLDEKRDPVEAKLSFRDAAGQQLMVASGPGARTSALSTDERGEALASGLPAERLIVEVRRGWLHAGQEFPLDLRTEPPGVVELVLGKRSTVSLGVLVLGAADSAQAPPAGSGPETWGQSLPAQLAQGVLWPLETDALVRVTDATGKVHAETRLDAQAPADDLERTRSLLPAAVRPILAHLTVPTGTALTLTVEAAGYALHTQPYSASDNAASDDATELLVLLRRN